MLPPDTPQPSSPPPKPPRQWHLWAGLGAVALLIGLGIQFLPGKFISTSIILPAIDTHNNQATEIKGRLIQQTQQLKAALAAYQLASDKAAALPILQQTAEERAATLQQAMEIVPAAVLEVALSSSQRQQFPTESQTILEETVIITGQYFEGHTDPNPDQLQQKPKPGPRYFYSLHTDQDQWLTMHFAQLPSFIPQGSHVQVEGVKLDKHIAVSQLAITSSQPTTNNIQGIKDVVAPVTQAQTDPAVPAYSSLTGANQTLYLDFNGHFEPQWGSYTNITIPVFDQDGDPTTFSASELTTINQSWQQVAEDYAPFKINVTTVQPSSFANGAALRVAIGGNCSILGANCGGVAYVDSFTNSIANTVFVFPQNLANGNAKYMSEAIAHESGHGFGLQHQSLWSNGTLIDEYYDGPGDGRGAIMGNSYYTARGLWWKGTPKTTETTLQDDTALISRTENGFGYRADDHGNTTSTATPLTISNGQFNQTGLESPATDKDYFSFSLTADSPLTATTTMPANPNLDSILTLLSGGGDVVATDDPSTSLDATLSSFLTAGTYYLSVLSHGCLAPGGNGPGSCSFDGGSYTLTGNVNNAASPSPTNNPSPSPEPSPSPSPSDLITPTTSISSPINGAVVTRNTTVNIMANASDNTGVTKVEFYVSGSLKCSDNTAGYSCSWKVPGPRNKSYTLQTKAYDASGNIGTSTPVTVRSN